MNLRSFGVLYESNSHKLWVNPGSSPLILDVVRAQLDHICPPQNNDDLTTVRSAFLMMEAFIVDAEWQPGTRLAKYWSMRSGLSVAEKWELFGAALSAEDCNILFAAYNHTRPQNVHDVEEEPEKKEPQQSKEGDDTLNNTEAQEPQPSTVSG